MGLWKVLLPSWIGVRNFYRVHWMRVPLKRIIARSIRAIFCISHILFTRRSKYPPVTLIIYQMKACDLHFYIQWFIMRSKIIMTKKKHLKVYTLCLVWMAENKSKIFGIVVCHEMLMDSHVQMACYDILSDFSFVLTPISS